MTAPLPEAEATALVEQLKREADRHWWINANRSLELAEEITRIGRSRGDRGQMALGAMARGDALKFLGRTREAWDALDEAGTLFLADANEVGWARTRIGRLMICVDLDHVDDALADAERAREIFTRRDEREKLLRLELNTAIVYSWLGDHSRALALYQSALARAEALGPEGETFLGVLCTSIGTVYEALGDFRAALASHERAHAVCEARAETRGLALADANMACILLAQGRYRRALHLLYRARESYTTAGLELDTANVNRDIIEAYLLLNRYGEARALAQSVAEAYRTFGVAFGEARALLHLATAEAALGDLRAARAALDSAEPLFIARNATSQIATTRLWRGRIALARGHPDQARVEAAAAAIGFAACGEQVNRAHAWLLRGQADGAEGMLRAAERAGEHALSTAQRCSVLTLRYAAHVLLGRVAQAAGDRARALRRYRAAMATIDRAQRGLTITLRPGFLEDKGDALRALMALHLADGSIGDALETLERARAQTWFTYLTNRAHLRWAVEEADSRTRIEEMERLRAEHHWWYRRAHTGAWNEDGPSQDTTAAERERALQEIATRERRMRAITEQLYLASGERQPLQRVALPRVADIQRCLDARTLLIEFYDDATHLWAFTVDAHSVRMCQLPASMADAARLLAQLQLNIAAALAIGAEGRVPLPVTQLGKRICQQLYTALLRPLEGRLAAWDRLMIVPYGTLHYLPFHLLHNGAGYLIEQHEVVVVPSAGLLTRRTSARPTGVRALVHNPDGTLVGADREARLVQRLLGGERRGGDMASRAALQAPPMQVLHLAAHGEHRLDQPDLSYIELADGPLYADDLLQLDLSYELVTLSACQTGRAFVAPGDELIGLGRGFLYAGAGALIASLWRVPDAATAILMKHLYGALKARRSKAAAVRAAQRAMLEREPDLHPAFWGAFQLIGDPAPLTAGTHTL
ncbi:MAG TPA: CHAT domain-containing tetratricopeptide repeat protein [Ktedonobacterales bacterium]